MAAEENRKLYGIRLEPALRKRLDALAKKDRRTFSNYVEWVLTSHLEAIGHRPKTNGAVHHEKAAA